MSQPAEVLDYVLEFTAPDGRQYRATSKGGRTFVLYKKFGNAWIYKGIVSCAEKKPTAEQFWATYSGVAT